MLDRIKSLLTPSVTIDARVKGISLFMGKCMEAFEKRISSLEARQLVHGKDGRDGKDGKDGRDGKDGKAGATGSTGPAGKAGTDGKAGVSVVDAEVAADDHLVLKLSNGKIIDAGELPAGRSNDGSVFVAGNAWQITVSSTAPSSPQLNDLWLDIS